MAGAVAQTRQPPLSRIIRKEMGRRPIQLVDVLQIASIARRVVAEFEHEFSDLLAGVEVHHIGATALPHGHTKGDVDVNVRSDALRFPLLVAGLRERLQVAQPENWSESFASFSTDAYQLPLGVQVTRIGSTDDFLLDLRDRMRADPSLARRYDDAKTAAALAGAEAYWNAKNTFLRELLAD
jgi:GrpB-like predicted nucleotidyltransferase (UPF0157 family)